MGTQNEDKAMSLYVCVISDPQKFHFVCPMERNLQMHNQYEPMTNTIPNESNESDLREDSCD